MSEEQTQSDTSDTIGKTERQLAHMRLPGFITDKDIGLGDMIKRVTSSIGIKPCSGCEHRAATLNRWIVFKGRRSK